MRERIPAEEKDKIIGDARARLESYVAEGQDVDKYSVDLKYWLEEQPGVAKATLRGRSTITVEFEDSTRVGILLDRTRLYGGWPDAGLVRASLWEGSGMVIDPRWTIVGPLNTPGTKSALLFDPLYDDWPPESTTDSIEAALSGAGYTVDRMLGDDGDLAHLETIEDNEYGVIFIRSHGGVIDVGGNDKIHIMARPYYDSWPDPASSGYNGIDVFYVRTDWGWKYAYAFNDEFVRHHLAATVFPNTLMHLLVCHGADPVGADDIIAAFLDFGVGCYTGWTRNATLDHGDPAAVAFFEYLCGAYGRTASGAIRHVESLGHSPDPISGAELVAHGDSTLALVGLRSIVVEMPPDRLKVLAEIPKEPFEVILELPPEVHLPDWSPIGGKLTPVDRLGRRHFLPYGASANILGSEEAMAEAIESLKR